MPRTTFMLSLVVLISLASDAHATVRSRRPQRRSIAVAWPTRVIAPPAAIARYATARAAAQAKAEIQARAGACFHPGGDFGGGIAEGVGYSPRSARDALANCCFSGWLPVAAESCVRGRYGWHACKIYK